MTPISGADSPHSSSYRGVHAAVFAILLLCHGGMAAFMRYPTVVYDELVYAGFARYFSRAAPMPNLYGGVYGHFGYSLLIAPLYAIRAGFEWQYHATLLLNSAILAAMYFPLFALLSRLFTAPRRVLIAAAAITALYPPYLLYSNYVVAENLFIPLYLVIALLVVRFLDRATAANAVLLGAATPLLYVVHTRGAGVVLAVAAVVGFLASRRKTSMPACALVLVLIAAGLISMEYAKARIDHWSPEVLFQDRRVPLTMRTVNDVKLAILSLTGQLLYLMQATFGLYVLGLVYLAKRMLNAFRKRQAAVSGGIAFLLASHGSVMAGSAYFISRQQPLTRLDLLFLGRYGEGVLAPIVAAGLLLAYQAWRFPEWQPAFTRAVIAAIALLSSGVVFLTRYIEVSILSILSGQLHINAIGLVGPALILPHREVELLCVASLFVLLIFALVSRQNITIAWTIIAGLFVACAVAAYAGAVLPSQDLTGFNAAARTPARLDPLLARIPAGEVAYDAARWDSFTFSQYQFYHPELRFRVFDSRTSGRPCCAVAIAGGKWPDAAALHFTAVGAEEMSDSTLWVQDPDLARRLAGTQSYVGLEIGNRMMPGIVTSGVYPEERGEPGEFRWTDGHGAIRVPIQPGDRPTKIELFLAALSPTPATVRVDGRIAVDETLKAGTNPFIRPVTVRPGQTAVSIAIDSGTFTPPASAEYRRTLGVEIRSIRLR